MNTQDIIAAKRDGRELTAEDISAIVLGYTAGGVPDYQMSAFLMAVYIRGMTFDEITALTKAMIASGATLDLSLISGIKVDKHSTGGVGDKTTLVVVPMLAACGLKVPKMSGRGLGFTGGTLDKLESIPGFTTNLSMERFVGQVNDIGGAIAGQSADIVPADKKMYALRDVTATVESIPLIAASVMSKKIACGSDVILLDVKVGSGAFMREIDSARELARAMIAIGTNLGRTVGAAITDMNQPLGRAVGNALEVAEAIETLQGNGPEDLRNLCIELSSLMLQTAGRCAKREQAVALADSVLDSGAALDMFRKIVAAQGGDARVTDDPAVLPKATHVQEIVSGSSGHVESIDCAGIDRAASLLGAGRERKEDSIDPAVGIIVHKKLGGAVKKGEAIATLHANNPALLPQSASLILRSYTLGARTTPPPLVHETL